VHIVCSEPQFVNFDLLNCDLWQQFSLDVRISFTNFVFEFACVLTGWFAVQFLERSVTSRGTITDFKIAMLSSMNVLPFNSILILYT